MRFGVAQAVSSDEEAAAFVVGETPSPSNPIPTRGKSRFSAPLLTGDSSGSGSSSDSTTSYSSTEEDAYEDAKAKALVARFRSRGSPRPSRLPSTPTPASREGRDTKQSGAKDVGPNVGPPPQRDSGKAKGKSRDSGVPGDGVSAGKKAKLRESKRDNGPKMVIAMDEWDAWDLASRHTALIRAHAAAEAFRASLSPSSSRYHPAVSPRKPPAARREEQAEETTELDDVRAMLQNMEIKRAEESKRAHAEFQRRNEELWKNIESTIQSADQAESQRQEEIAKQKANEEALRIRLRKEAEDKARREKEEQDRKVAEAAAKREAARLADVAKKEAERVNAAEAQARVQEERNHVAGAALLQGIGKKRQEWQTWRDKHQSIKREIIEPIKADPALKRDVGRLRTTIRSRIGQCTNSRDKIVSVVQEISDVLQRASGALNPIRPDNPMTAVRNPPIQYRYLLTQTSKYLIKQAEEEVQPNPDAAYKLAKIAVGLMILGHVTLGEILMARLVKKCCFVLPYYPAQAQGQPEAEYRKSVGQNPNQPEDAVQYALRMSAILRFYLAIIGTDLRTIVAAFIRTELQDYSSIDPYIYPSFRLGAGWSWLTGILRDPMPGYDPTPQLLIAALETVGQELTFAYGEREMGKVMVLILTEGLGINMASGQQEAPGEIAPQNKSAREQLKILLGPLIAHGRFEIVPAKVWED